MSLILRYVNVSSTCVSVEESFLGFLNVDDATDQGLFDVTQVELKALDLDINGVRGQGYDNGSNMKGKHQVQDLISFFKEFRVTGFSNEVDVAKQIAIEMDINPLFIQKRAVVSLTTRFEQYPEYEDIFGFLFTYDKLKLYDDDRRLNNYLPNENMRPLDVLNFLKQDDYYPNAIIAYRALLTIPVTVASAERSFSKLKLLKSYLRSTMSQERLNVLALIAIENNILESVNYDDLINFASKNARRIALFK
ncbi:zinc finger MYM-type protein 1 [Tanacetum coccineum]